MSLSCCTGTPTPTASRDRNAGVTYRLRSLSYETPDCASRGATAVTSCGKRTTATTRTAYEGPFGAGTCSTPPDNWPLPN